MNRRSEERTVSATGAVTWSSSKKKKRHRPSVGARRRLALSRGGSTAGIGATPRTTIGAKLVIACARPFSSTSKSDAASPVIGRRSSSRTIASSRTTSTAVPNTGGC
jgi:hypothetical protein